MLAINILAIFVIVTTIIAIIKTKRKPRHQSNEEKAGCYLFWL